MEIKIKQSELIKGLLLVQGIVERKTTMPILTNVLVEASGKNITLIATDLEVSVNCSLMGDIVKEGKITVHARGLYDIVKELPDEPIHFKVSDGKRIDISCGRSQFKIVGLSPDDFPALPKKGDGSSIKIEGTLLNQMIEKTAFAMSTDEMRGNLNGIFLELTSTGGVDLLKMVAIDGHRLSIIERQISGKLKISKGVIIPRKGVLELKKLIEVSDGILDVWIDEKHAIISNGKTTLIIRLFDGQFPPYSQVIPTKAVRKIAMDRKSILQALRRVSVLSVDKARGVKFIFSTKNLELSTFNPDFGEAKEELSVDYKGERFEVGFNAKYFMDVLGVIGDEKAEFQMGDDTTPCIVKSSQDKGFTHIVMPMRLS